MGEEFISVGGGFWLIRTQQKCILVGRSVGLLGVCCVDGVMQAYSVSYRQISCVYSGVRRGILTVPCLRRGKV